MARYFNKDSMSDTFDHIQKVVIPPVTTPLESLLAERQLDALCSVHVAAEDYPEHVDRSKRLKMSFLFCKKEAYPQMRAHLAQTFPAALVIEHTSGLDFGLLRQLNSDAAAILSELLSTRLWILPFYPSLQNYRKSLTTYGVSLIDLCKQKNFFGFSERSHNLCICDLLIFGKSALYLLNPPRILHVSDLFSNNNPSYSPIKQLIQTLHEAGSYMSGMLDYSLRSEEKEIPYASNNG